MKIIVSDTGPVLHLKEAGLLKLLQKAGKVCIPKMVDNELNEIDPLWRKEKPEWIFIEPLQPDEIKETEFLFISGLISLGEAEAIVLAKRLNPKWFLTDDTEARIFATSLEMEVHGSLGIVLWSAAVGNLNYPEAEEAIEKLSKTSLWVSKDILSQAHEALKIIFEKK